MSEWIGDLMAVADDDDAHEPGRTPKRRKQTRSKKMQAQSAPENLSQKDPIKWKQFPPKLRGELGELDFLRKTLGMGMLVSKPWGDSYRYDFIVDWEGRLSRTQVRSTERINGPSGYAVHASVWVGTEHVPLTAKDIDVLVAYVSSRNIWYVVPVGAFSPRARLHFYPDGSTKGALFENYREAWWVMMREK
ncbi:MAG: group I intron-associated PD-(D/E)XK endonuclease [Candidatus Sulfotelmatobacter sp.]